MFCSIEKDWVWHKSQYITLQISEYCYIRSDVGLYFDWLIVSKYTVDTDHHGISGSGGKHQNIQINFILFVKGWDIETVSWYAVYCGIRAERQP